MVSSSMVQFISLKRSANPEKKYDATIETDTGREKTISFGNAGSRDFTLTKDEVLKKNYIARHRVREDWTDPTTAGFWSKNILWNKKTIAESLRDTKARFF